MVKQKGFYTYEYMRGFGKFKEGLSSKERFYSSSTCTKICDNEYEHVLKISNKFENKSNKRLSRLVLNIRFFINS